MPDGVRIRRGSAADVEAVVALELRVAEAPHWTAEAYALLVRDAGGTAAGVTAACMTAAGRTAAGDSVARWLVVADAAEGIVGFAAASAAGDVGEIESVVVAPEWRRRGLGAALCRDVLARCGRWGAGVVLLEVRSASLGAQALYASLGFVASGSRRSYYEGPRDDAIVMRLSLVAT